MALTIETAEDLERVDVTSPVLSPAEAEIHFTFRMRRPLDDFEFRGRLTGPQCPYSTTIEIAYPVRPVTPAGGRTDTVTGRAIIPEPSLWDPVAPFLYRGTVSLWSAGRPLVRATVSHGLRSAQLTPKGLRWNGKPLTLRARKLAGLDRDAIERMRRAGENACLLPAAGAALGDWLALADRFGAVALLELAGAADLEPALSAGGRACCLGLVAPQSLLADPAARGRLTGAAGELGWLVGARLDGPDPDPEWGGLAFVVCDTGLSPHGPARLVRAADPAAAAGGDLGTLLP